MEYKNGKAFIFITSLLCIPTPILAKTINNNEVLSNCFIQLIPMVNKTINTNNFTIVITVMILVILILLGATMRAFRK